MNEWLNRNHHGLNLVELEQTLFRLIDSGDLEAFYEVDETGFTPTRHELRSALRSSGEHAWGPKQHKKFIVNGQRRRNSRMQVVAIEGCISLEFADY